MKTLIILLQNRMLVEKIENQIFENNSELVSTLRSLGMSEEEEENLGYYELTDFMDLVNDQVLDNLESTFIGYVTIKA